MHKILIEEFNYELDQNKIAQIAAEPRDSGKLLFYDEGVISDHVFKEIHHLLPEKSALFINNARVIPARFFLKNKHNAQIEILLLNPYKTEYSKALNALNICEWDCMIGNLKKWKKDEILSIQVGSIHLSLTHSEENRVIFKWDGNKFFSEIIEEIGKIPLPPYIKHEANETDKERYQTVYSSIKGSVAAPTAGLHFTNEVFSNIRSSGIPVHELTLHVGAGTFLPVKSEDARLHNMHSEIYSIGIHTLEGLKNTEFPIAVGTTACRVLESIYWVAANIYEGRENPYNITQFRYEEKNADLSFNKAIEILMEHTASSGRESISGETSIMISPSYKFRVIKGLISNFHQPRSTLLLLIAAFIGEDWKTVYKHALHNEYRFLSYGDSSLLLPK